MSWKTERPRGLGGLVRRLEKSLQRASIRWRFGHAMRRTHAPPAPGPHPLVMVCDGLSPGGNVGRIIRSAEVFGAREVHVIGTPVFDPAFATTALHAIPLRFFKRREASFAQLARDGYTLVVLENDEAATAVLPGATLPPRAALVVGNETRGVGFGPADYPDAQWMSIRMFGRTECLDVCTAAGVGMYEWTRQHGSTPG